MATGKQYVIGKGRIYFNSFAAGTKNGKGERYLGNSPELTLSTSQDTLDHIDSDQGLNVKDEQVTISNDLTGTFKLDSIEAANIGMWFGGDVDTESIVAATAVTDVDQTMLRGLWYQIGKSEATPGGTRKVTNVSFSIVTPGALPADPPVVTAVPSGSVDANFDIDLERARVYVELTAPLVDAVAGAVVRVKYDQENVTREIVIGKGEEVRGELRFLSANPIGLQRDYYMPYVKITSNGDYALKGDSWQEMSFNYEVLKKDDATERLYIDGVASATP